MGSGFEPAARKFKGELPSTAVPSAHDGRREGCAGMRFPCKGVSRSPEGTPGWSDGWFRSLRPLATGSKRKCRPNLEPSHELASGPAPSIIPMVSLTHLGRPAGAPRAVQHQLLAIRLTKACWPLGPPMPHLGAFPGQLCNVQGPHATVSLIGWMQVKNWRADSGGPVERPSGVMRNYLSTAVKESGANQFGGYDLTETGGLCPVIQHRWTPKRHSPQFIHAFVSSSSSTSWGSSREKASRLAPRIKPPKSCLDGNYKRTTPQT